MSAAHLSTPSTINSLLQPRLAFFAYRLLSSHSDYFGRGFREAFCSHGDHQAPSTAPFSLCHFIAAGPPIAGSSASFICSAFESIRFKHPPALAISPAFV